MLVQSNARYAPMSVPSTPDAFASVPWSNVPCGAAASAKKFLQPYSVAVTTIRDAAPRSSGRLDAILIVSPFVISGRLLERRVDADGERSTARIRTAVDPAILIPDVTGGTENVRRRGA